MDDINIDIPKDLLYKLNNLLKDANYGHISLDDEIITLQEAMEVKFTLELIIEDSNNNPMQASIQGLTKDMAQTAQELLPEISSLIEPKFNEHIEHINKFAETIMLPIKAVMLANPITIASSPELLNQALEEALKRTNNAIQSIGKPSSKSR
ncbi:hypothetical protein [Methylovulum psychrotolerans]|uniref:Uncharacterized protein n=1 Tax=Methylovulum psychrotolerans TaxID=1704499 RepID=A0A2S5CFR4_9GAMM|nr:hypothetical protein [Methylovulum psychrotolerans]POZ49653.1 hypothetical protein AADEFJLK_04569 [Methylovulum psychrotolerans]